MSKKTWTFLAICFGITYAAAALFHFLGGRYAAIGGTVLAMCIMLVPMLSVIITQLMFHEKPLSNCGIGWKLNRWWFVAWLGMPLFVCAAILVSLLMPGVSFTLESGLMLQSISSFSQQGLAIGPWGVIAITLLSGLIAGLTINALFGFGEEIAWRGFLARDLNSLGFWKKSLLIGCIWGLWHAPLILMGHNYPAHPVLGVLMMTIFCTLFSPVLMYLRERAKSVLVAAIAHGTMNAVAGLAIILLSGYNDLLCGFCGVAGFIVLIVVDLIIALTYHPQSEQSAQSVQ